MSFLNFDSMAQTGGNWAKNAKKPMGGQYMFEPSDMPSYDFTQMQNATTALQNVPKYTPKKFEPYQFSFGGPQQFGDLYNQYYKSGASQLSDQNEESMRKLGQGFGSKGISGAAQQELKMKGGQQYGKGLQGLQQDLMGKTMDMQLNAAMDQQKSQADMNFKAAGFDNTNAKYLSELAMKYADSMFNMGHQQNQLQQMLNQQYMDQMNKDSDYFARLGDI